MLKLTLALWLCLSAFISAESPIHFSNLPKGDTLRISLVGSGCFHYYNYELVFQRAAGTGKMVAEVVELCAPGERDQQAGRKVKRVALGTVALTEQDCAGLDKLLSYYRIKKEGWCTWGEWIEFTQTRNSRPLATEKFAEFFRENPHPAVKGSTSLGEIIERVKKDDSTVPKIGIERSGNR